MDFNNHPYVVEYDRAAAEGRAKLIASFEHGHAHGAEDLLAGLAEMAKIGVKRDRLMPMPLEDAHRWLRGRASDILRLVVGPYRYMVPGLDALLGPLDEAVMVMHPGECGEDAPLASYADFSAGRKRESQFN